MALGLEKAPKLIVGRSDILISPSTRVDEGTLSQAEGPEGKKERSREGISSFDQWYVMIKRTLGSMGILEGQDVPYTHGDSPVGRDEGLHHRAQGHPRFPETEKQVQFSLQFFKESTNQGSRYSECRWDSREVKEGQITCDPLASTQEPPCTCDSKDHRANSIVISPIGQSGRKPLASE